MRKEAADVKFSIRSKIFLLCISVVLLLGISVFVTVYIQVSKLVTTNIEQQLDSNVDLGYQLLESKYPGQWSIQGESLYKGKKLINDDTEFVDEVKAATGCPATIFLGDTRVSTNVIKDGKRAVGTKAAEGVISAVIGKGTEYIGEAIVVDKLYEAKYMPIKGSDGKTIGMWFVGVEKGAITSQINKMMLIISAITLITIIFALIISWFVIRQIDGGIKSILGVLGKMSAGDLSITSSAKTKDEIGLLSKHLNETSQKIGSLISTIKNNNREILDNTSNLNSVADEMATSAISVSTAIQEVAKGTSSQAEDLSQITGVLSDFGKNLEGIVESISEVGVSTKEIGSMANNSNDNMRLLVDSISNIGTAFNGYIGKISSLSLSINRINEITSVINGIADQTNLLALNAAIEAARAGEAGKGFSVVADEIRKLAEQSKRSSNDITELISSISTETGKIVKDANAMNEEINGQVGVIESAIESFKSIITAIEGMIPKVEAINASAGTIGKSKDRILDKVENASSVAQEVSASSEEITALAEEMSASSEEVAATLALLSGMAKNMSEQVNRFKLA